jgi:glucokinase
VGRWQAADDPAVAGEELVVVRVSAERVLSGPGLVALHAAARALTGVDTPDLGSADIVALASPDEGVNKPSAAISEASPAQVRCCAQALRWFVGFLAGVAGNHALSVGARGGVYLGGGIPPRILGTLRQPFFRERFEAKGRMGDYLRRIPVFVIDAKSPPALRGAAGLITLDASTGGEALACSVRPTSPPKPGHNKRSKLHQISRNSWHINSVMP